MLCSLVLASAYVAYRSGAMTTAPGKPTSEVTPNLDDGEVPFLLEPTENDRRMMSGSKSGIMFVSNEKPKDPPRHMGGSKRGDIVLPSDFKSTDKSPDQPASQPAPAQPK